MGEVMASKFVLGLVISAWESETTGLIVFVIMEMPSQIYDKFFPNFLWKSTEWKPSYFKRTDNYDIVYWCIL